jgi:polyisoprenyl-teichoic acid--peptidoglycan teichoic acid transferase
MQKGTKRLRPTLKNILLTMLLVVCVAGSFGAIRVASAVRRATQARDVRPNAALHAELAELAEPAMVAPTSAPATATAASEAVTVAKPTVAPTLTPTPEPEPTPVLLQKPFTVLLIGIDTRDEGPNGSIRSDTLMLLRIDPQHNGASILSIPRDTLVTIPSKFCGGKRKINAAYACGFRHPKQYGEDVVPTDAGAALAAETVEAFLDVPVHYTAQIDFAGFVQVVDAIGGITVDVPKEIIDPAYPTADYGTMRLHIKKGVQHMTGEEALRYARTRHADSDFGRIKRQQQVVMDVLRQYKSQHLWQQISSAPALIDIFGDSVQTTLPLTDSDVVRGLANAAEQLQHDRVRQLSLQPLKMANGNFNVAEVESSLQWNKQYVAAVVEDFLSPPDEDETVADDHQS